MIHARKGTVIIEWDKPEEWAANRGIILPSPQVMRDILRKEVKHEISADAPPPDIYRWGVLVDGECDAPVGALVYFNRHDGHAFEHEGKSYFTLPALLVLAYRLSTPSA